LIKFIEKMALRSLPHAEIENLFSHLELIAPALAVGGILILVAGILEKLHRKKAPAESSDISSGQAALIGAVQGLCLPFRGFSRSGATISTGMLAGVAKASAERFSFALAVVLTPAAIARESMRLAKAEHFSGYPGMAAAVMPSLLGAVCAFVAGLLALKWLSRWLEGGRWYLFGIYCLVAAVAVAALHHAGY
jgi:undecaprenyl-diphosphatase